MTDPVKGSANAGRSSVGARLHQQWKTLSGLPFGSWLFSVLLGRLVRYSGSIKPRVVELAPGRAVIRMADRRAIRNHLGSIHAVALTNLGELASGLALTLMLPGHVRGIVVRLETEFVKKARGTLVATADVTLPPGVAENPEFEPTDHQVQTVMRDQEGDVVATTTVVWKLAPR